MPRSILDDRAKDPTNPASTAEWYDEMSPVWEKIDAVLGGTQTMKAAGTGLLPQHDREADSAYKERLARSVLYNQTDITLDAMVGRPFSDPVHRKDVPTEFEPWLNDIDMQGNAIDVAAREWFRDGVAKGYSHMLVDFPRPPEKTDGDGNPRERTRQDDLDDGLRPYWVHIAPERLFDAHAEIIGGREVLTHVRFVEHKTIRDGFTARVVERIRAIEPGLVTVFELMRTKTNKNEWVIVEQYETQLDFVPLVTFYADREGFMFAKPPINDLADLNIAHWQSYSDQVGILTIARFPILAGSGISGRGDIPVGPYTSLTTDDPQGRFYYVEHSGKAIAAGETDLDKLENRMSEYGAQFLKKRPGALTATARALDSAEATSPLQDMSLRFMDALNNAWRMMSAWTGDDPASFGMLTVSTEFGPEEPNQADLQAIDAARKDGDISRSTRLKELQRRGTLADDFDEEQNLKELEAEREEFADGETDEDIDPPAKDAAEMDDDGEKEDGDGDE